MIVFLTHCYCFVVVIVLQEVHGLSQNDAIGSLDFAYTFADALESLKDDPTYPIPSSVTFVLQSVTYELRCPYCGDYVTRVRYTATVLNNDGLLPMVSSNLAASVYNYILQRFLQNMGGYTYVQIYNTGSFRANLLDTPTSLPTPSSSSSSLLWSVLPSSQPTSRPTKIVSGTQQPSRQPSRHPSRQQSHVPISMQMSRQPTSQPSAQPTTQPTKVVSGSGSGIGSFAPVAQGWPKMQPSSQPSRRNGYGVSGPPVINRQPTSQPTAQPSRVPTLDRSSGSGSGSATASFAPVAQTFPKMLPTSQPSRLYSVSTQVPTQPATLFTGRPTMASTGSGTGTQTWPKMLPTSQPSRLYSVSARLPGQPSSQPSRLGTRGALRKSRYAVLLEDSPAVQPPPTGQPTRQPTAAPTNSIPTLPPLASDGCVHVGFMALLSQTYNWNYFSVPAFGNSGDFVYYNVTIHITGGTGYFGSSLASWNEHRNGDNPFLGSSQLYSNGPSSMKFGPFSVDGNQGVFFSFFPYSMGSSLSATVCPFQTVPTARPTQRSAPGKQSSHLSPQLLVVITLYNILFIIACLHLIVICNLFLYLFNLLFISLLPQWTLLSRTKQCVQLVCHFLACPTVSGL